MVMMIIIIIIIITIISKAQILKFNALSSLQRIWRETGQWVHVQKSKDILSVSKELGTGKRGQVYVSDCDSQPPSQPSPPHPPPPPLNSKLNDSLPKNFKCLLPTACTIYFLENGVASWRHVIMHMYEWNVTETTSCARFNDTGE